MFILYFKFGKDKWGGGGKIKKKSFPQDQQ